MKEGDGSRTKQLDSKREDFFSLLSCQVQGKKGIAGQGKKGFSLIKVTEFNLVPVKVPKEYLILPQSFLSLILHLTQSLLSLLLSFSFSSG